MSEVEVPPGGAAGVPGNDADLASLRRDYRVKPLLDGSLAADPIVQFRAWFAEVVAQPKLFPEPNAMVVSTADADGVVTARTVLLKGVGDAGFTFFTNYSSRKAAAITQNPHVALLFPWHPMSRQVLVQGTAARLDAAASAAYFKSRPRASQIAAWTSHQSTVLRARDELERRHASLEARFEGREVDVPDFWGGFVVEPSSVEFWQGAPDRLHDRLRYRRDPSGWVIERLSP